MIDHDGMQSDSTGIQDPIDLESPGLRSGTEISDGLSGNHLVCRYCHNKITRSGARISVRDNHEHVFFNPHGHIFEVGCFSFARGCSPIGPPSSEFSWFPGFSWQIIQCSVCSKHLGWHFSSSGRGAFYGLITNNLVESEEKEPK